MGANFSRFFVETAGNTIFAANYNGEFNNILTNFTPAGMDDASANVAAMQTTVDPGEVSSESLPTSLEGEIHRLRHVIKEITGKDQWYESPAGPGLSAPSSGTSTDNAIILWDGTDANSVQESDVTIDPATNNVTIPEKVVAAATTAANTTFTATAVSTTDAWDFTDVTIGDIIVASNGSKAIITSIGVQTLTASAGWDSTTPTDNTHSAYVKKASSSQLSVPNFGVVPIGAIIDFWNAGATLTLPDNFVKCDGQEISDVDSPLNGVTLPNLNVADGVYTIGTNAASHNTTIDGDADHSVTIVNHTHTMSSHTHTLPSITGNVSISGSSPGAVNYNVYDDSTGWGIGNLATSGAGSSTEGQHYHNLVGSTGAPSTANTGSGGGHTVNIKGASLPVWKVMRIK